MKKILIVLLGVSFFVACVKEKGAVNDELETVGPVDASGNAIDSNQQTSNLLKIYIEDLANNQGKVLIALYQNEQEFDDETNPFIGDSVDATSSNLLVQYANLPAGDYAIALFHDENENAELDQNFLGIPQEGYGFSTNPGFLLSKPSFDDVSFQISAQGEQEQIINVKYGI